MKDFSIPRSPIPLINQVLLIFLAGELVFAMSIILLALIRNSLSIDVTLALFAWGAFFVKAFLVMLYTAKLLHRWLKTTYAIINSRLVIFSKKDFESELSSSPALKSVTSVRVNQNRNGRRFNYGNITISFDDSLFPDPITLLDVQDPKAVAAQLGALNRGSNG